MKFSAKMMTSCTLLLIAVIALVLVLVLNDRRNNRKKEGFEGIVTNDDAVVVLETPPTNTVVNNANTSPDAVDMSEIESEFLKTDEKDGNLVDAPVKKTSVKPTELLPKTDAASTWADANPVSDPGLDENLLDAGFHVGVNTVGQSLRNANLQIRSEPANPVSNVSPWLNTTISPDLERRPLEICSDDVAAAFNVVGLGGGSEEFASLA